MSIDFYIKLTLAVYRVTELFPEGEPLKSQTRESANKILAALINNQSENVSRSIKILKECFDKAETQNWVDSRNFSVLCREYDKIEQLINTEKTVEKPRITKKRKEKILETLEGNSKIKVGDLIKIFPDINRRTILRDLENFSQAGLVVKIGDGRGACYKLRNATL